jgi:hypothetical protein
MIAAGALPAQADVQLAARHTLVAIDTTESGSIVTVDLTLSNTGDETLDSISVKPAGIVYTAPDADGLAIATLLPGAEQTNRWVLHTSQTEQLEAVGSVIGANVSAVKTSGEAVELNIGSQGGE